MNSPLNPRIRKGNNYTYIRRYLCPVHIYTYKQLMYMNIIVSFHLLISYTDSTGLHQIRFSTLVHDNLFIGLCLAIFDFICSHLCLMIHAHPSANHPTYNTYHHSCWLIHGSLPTEVTAKILIHRASADPFQGFCSVGHKADVKKHETTQEFLNGHQVSSTGLRHNSVHDTTSPLALVLIVHIFSFNNFIINVHDGITN